MTARPVPATVEQKQHVEMYRKVLLRKRLLRWAPAGAVYVPFIGDGDIADVLYRDRTIYGADLDHNRVEFAQERFPGQEIKVADCDSWPFPHLTDTFAIADFDAYAEPYISFRSFWGQAQKADRLVMYFTDGRRQGLERTGHWTRPDGQKLYLPPRSGAKSLVFTRYLSAYIWPWFDDHIKPWRVLERYRYLRGMMVYWGVAIERPRDT
jgi:hypothetical protein